MIDSGFQDILGQTKKILAMSPFEEIRNLQVQATVTLSRYRVDCPLIISNNLPKNRFDRRRVDTTSETTSKSNP